MTTDPYSRNRADTRALENSEQEFIARYAEYAASGELYPQVEGSPLMEFGVGGRVLYLFDRTGPYTACAGRASVIVHGLLNRASLELHEEAPASGEALTVTSVSGVEGSGRLLAASLRTWVVQARLPLVLSYYDPLPPASVGQWISFTTVPPLHGFLVKSS